MSVDPTSTEGRAELREMLENAVPGPWKIDEHDESNFDSIVSVAEDRPFGWVEVARSLSPESDLIVAAVNALPKLLDALEELEADIERRKIRNTLSRMGGPDEPETIEAWRENTIGWKERAERAEAALARVRKLANDHRNSVRTCREINAALEGES